MASRWVTEIVMDGNTVTLTVPSEAPPTMGALYEKISPALQESGDAVFVARAEGVQSKLLKGGAYFCFNYRPNQYSQGFGIFENSDYTNSISSIAYGDLWKDNVSICIAVDDDLEEAQFGIYGNRQYGGGPLLVCSTGRTDQSQRQASYQMFLSSQPAHFIWTAWEQLAGNSGQYRCQLSKLTDTALEDISPQVGQTSAIFDRISSRSSIWSIIQNAQLGEEKTIMWSGRNWCTMTMTAGGVSGNYALAFKFYNPNMSETTPFYTYTTYIVYSPGSPDVNTDSNLLLAFAYDNAQQAALFLPVTYRAGGLAEGYSWGVSSQNMPDSDQLLYLYLWLQESGAGTPEYPYDTGSEDNGGNPSGPQPGDHMPQPGVPTLSAMSSGMFTVYCPTDEQLEDIAEYLWSDNVITNIRKYFNNFSDNIIALYVLPHQPANLPTKNFTVGNLQSDTITGVKYVTSRFVDVDMGSVTVKTTYDSYLDFSPFTRFEIYLPGVGMQTLSADDIMCPTDPNTGTLKPVEESTISVKYTLDLMTGLLVAFVFVNGEMRYQFPGKIGYSIPITGENYTRMVTGAISAMAGLVGAAATGGLTAPLAAGGVAAAVSGTVNAMKPDVHRSGNLSGDVSMMSDESPYLIYHRPNKPLLENQERYTGFPSYKSGALSEFSGLTQVIDAHIEGISCTEAERAEILNLLKSGVIL